MTQPLISICIANYNGEHLLSDCIDSLLAQDTDAEVEVIVHDDASQDGSLRLLAKAYRRSTYVSSKAATATPATSNHLLISDHLFKSPLPHVLILRPPSMAASSPTLPVPW